MACFRLVNIDVKMGVRSTRKIKRVEDVVIFITFIWSCTKFLVPKTNGLLLSYKSKQVICLSMAA